MEVNQVKFDVLFCTLCLSHRTKILIVPNLSTRYKGLATGLLHQEQKLLGIQLVNKRSYEARVYVEKFMEEVLLSEVRDLFVMLIDYVL